MKIELTEVKLNDYLLCPVYYDAVHNQSLPIDNKPTLVKLLETVSLTFYMNLLNGQILSPASLKTKWDKLIKKHQGAIDPKKCLEGLSQLQKMYLWAENEEIRIADVNTPYYIVVKDGNNVIEYKGEMAPIAMNRKDQFELLYTDFSRKTPDQAMLDIKLKYAMDSYAFKTLYGKGIGVRIHHVYKNTDYFLYKDQTDFERVNATIKGVGRGIQNKAYYPRESIFCCYCEMKDFCRMWSMKD